MAVYQELLGGGECLYGTGESFESRYGKVQFLKSGYGHLRINEGMLLSGCYICDSVQILLKTTLAILSQQAVTLTSIVW